MVGNDHPQKLFGTTIRFEIGFTITFELLNFKFLGPEILPELIQNQRDIREHTGHEHLWFDLAGASGSKVGFS